MCVYIHTYIFRGVHAQTQESMSTYLYMYSFSLLGNN